MADVEPRCWSEGHWLSRDGLRLHYRDYPGPAPGRDGAVRPPVLCLAGLTRNARDFAALAERLSPRHRVLAPDLRGRGQSGWARDAQSYTPTSYVQDIEGLIDELGIERLVVIGTSLGGLITMLLAAARPGLIAGAVLNDVGPELAADGLDRIRSYVGQARSYDSWVHAARALGEVLGDAHPEFALADWIAFAKRTHRIAPGGKIIADYDSRIAEPLRAPVGGAEADAVDLWPLFRTLASAPLTLLRGELSDLLPADVARRMAAVAPGIELVTVPRVGHAPTLDEPEALAAIERLLARVDAGEGQ